MGAEDRDDVTPSRRNSMQIYDNLNERYNSS